MQLSREKGLEVFLPTLRVEAAAYPRKLVETGLLAETRSSTGFGYYIHTCIYIGSILLVHTLTVLTLIILLLL